MISNSIRDHLLGISLVVFAFLAAAVMNALAKVVLTHTNVGNLLFMQNFWALICTLPLIFWYKKTLHITFWKWHLLRAISGLASYFCLFIAVQYISLIDATLLANSAPLFLPFVTWVWTKTKITLSLWVSLIIGFIGVVFIINPDGNWSHLFDSWMVLIALLGSLFSAIALQTVRYLRKHESTFPIVFYYFLIATCLLLPFSDWHSLSREDWELLMGVGICLAFIQAGLAQAYKYASPVLLGPFNYTVVIFAGLIDWWIWHVVPSLLGFCGILLISFGGISSILCGSKRKGR